MEGFLRAHRPHRDPTAEALADIVARIAAEPEVTERLASGHAVHWARLAAELGYADQAHLTRDFAAMFSETPTRYAQRYPIRSRPS